MTSDDQLVASYLRQLRRACRGLPRARRRELLAEIAEHIARAQEADPGPAALRTVLDQLGDPREIAAAASSATGITPLRGREIAAVVLLLAGALVGVVLGPLGIAGWVAGAVLLWMSPRWRWPDKLLGTLVWPGGLAAPLLLLFFPVSTETEACSGGPGQAPRCITTSSGTALPAWLGPTLLILAILGPVLVAIWLVHRARRAPAATG